MGPRAQSKSNPHAQVLFEPGLCPVNSYVPRGVHSYVPRGVHRGPVR